MLVLQKSYFKQDNGDRIQSIHLASHPGEVTPEEVPSLNIDLEKFDLNYDEGIIIPGYPNFLMAKILTLVSDKFLFVATANEKFGAIVLDSKDKNHPIGSVISKFKGV